MGTLGWSDGDPNVWGLWDAVLGTPTVGDFGMECWGPQRLGMQGWGAVEPNVWGCWGGGVFRAPQCGAVPPPGAAAMRRDEGCAAFGNVFTEVAENSAHGTVVARLPPGGGGVGGPGLQLCLEGADAAWFYLDGSSVRLNASNGRSLDREVGGPIRPPDSP